MALVERLQILIDANASGAVREFQKVGAAADRNIGAAEDRAKRLSAGLTSFGSTALAAGAVAATGLYRAASAASDLEEAVNKANVVLGREGAAAVAQFAEKAAESAGLSKRAATEAAASFAQFGKAAGLSGKNLGRFAVDLSQLAGDLASFNNTTTDEAVTALGAALRGESEPLRRYGVLLDDATLKAKALELGIYSGTGSLTQQQKVLAAYQVILEQTKDAQGDFLRTGDSLANQQRAAAAQLENALASLGQAAAPVFASLVGGLADVAGGFAKLDEGTGGAAGKLATVATGATIAVGGLSLVAGQLIKLRDLFTSVDANGVRSMNRIGGAAVAAGKVLGAAGIAYAIFEIGRAFNESTEDALSFKAALSDLQAIPTDGPARQVAEVFQRQVTAVEGSLDRLRDMFSGADTVFTFEGLRFELDNTREALDQLIESDPEQALRVVRELREALKGQQGEGTFAPIELDAFRKDLAGMERDLESVTGKSKHAADGMSGAGEAAGELADSVASVADESNDAAAALSALADGLKRSQSAADLARVGIDAAAAGAKAFTQSIEDSTFSDDLLSAAVGVAGAAKDLETVLANLPATFSAVDVAAGKTTEEQNRAIQALIGYGDQVQTLLQTFVAAGDTAGAQMFAGMVRSTLEAKGVGEEYLRVLGLMPDQVDTAIRVSGDAEALQRIQLYSQLLGEQIPRDVSTQVLAYVDDGKLQEAAFVLEAWRQQEQERRLVLPVEADLDPAVQKVAAQVVEIDNQQGTIKVLGDPTGWNDAQAKVFRDLGLLNAAKANPSIVANDDASKVLLEVENRLRRLDGRRAVSYVTTVLEERYGTRGVTAERTAERQGRVRRAAGGVVPGVGSGDVVPALLTPGEFVVRRDVVDRVGVGALQSLNAGVGRAVDALRASVGFASGGLVAAQPARVPTLVPTSVPVRQTHTVDAGVRIGEIRIESTDPVEAATEVVRRQRDLVFLAGV